MNRLIACGAALGGLAVLFGAFGVHALRPRLDAEELAWWQTGVQYQLSHAIAVLAIGASAREWATAPGWLLAAGTIVFSATLYAMALGAPHWLGAVTPLGGVAMICGWGLLAWRAIRRSEDGPTS